MTSAPFPQNFGRPDQPEYALAAATGGRFPNGGNDARKAGLEQDGPPRLSTKA